MTNPLPSPLSLSLTCTQVELDDLAKYGGIYGESTSAISNIKVPLPLPRCRFCPPPHSPPPLQNVSLRLFPPSHTHSHTHSHTSCALFAL
jgi:hypothetical protein